MHLVHKTDNFQLFMRVEFFGKLEHIFHEKVAGLEKNQKHLFEGNKISLELFIGIDDFHLVISLFIQFKRDNI